MSERCECPILATLNNTEGWVQGTEDRIVDLQERVRELEEGPEPTTEPGVNIPGMECASASLPTEPEAGEAEEHQGHRFLGCCCLDCQRVMASSTDMSREFIRAIQTPGFLLGKPSPSPSGEQQPAAWAIPNELGGCDFLAWGARRPDDDERWRPLFFAPDPSAGADVGREWTNDERYALAKGAEFCNEKGYDASAEILRTLLAGTPPAPPVEISHEQEVKAIWPLGEDGILRSAGTSGDNNAGTPPAPDWFGPNERASMDRLRDWLLAHDGDDGYSCVGDVAIRRLEAAPSPEQVAGLEALRDAVQVWRDSLAAQMRGEDTAEARAQLLAAFHALSSPSPAGYEIGRIDEVRINGERLFTQAEVRERTSAAYKQGNEDGYQRGQDGQAEAVAAAREEERAIHERALNRVGLVLKERDQELASLRQAGSGSAVRELVEAVDYHIYQWPDSDDEMPSFIRLKSASAAVRAASPPPAVPVVVGVAPGVVSKWAADVLVGKRGWSIPISGKQRDIAGRLLVSMLRHFGIPATLADTGEGGETSE